MLYRKSPPRPSRLLLRVVATAGTSALLGVGIAACGSAAAPGSLTMPPEDSGADHADGGPVVDCADGGCGIMVNPEGGDEVVGGGVVCEAGCGIMVSPDGGDAGMAGGGIMVNPEAGTD